MKWIEDIFRWQYFLLTLASGLALLVAIIILIFIRNKNKPITHTPPLTREQENFIDSQYQDELTEEEKLTIKQWMDEFGVDSKRSNDDY